MTVSAEWENAVYSTSHTQYMFLILYKDSIARGIWTLLVTRWKIDIFNVAIKSHHTTKYVRSFKINIQKNQNVPQEIMLFTVVLQASLYPPRYIHLLLKISTQLFWLSSFRNQHFLWYRIIETASQQAANEKLLTSRLADGRARELSCKQTSLYSRGNVHARFEHWLVKRDQTGGLPAGHVKASLPSLPVIFGLMTRHRDACVVSQIILRNSE